MLFATLAFFQGLNEPTEGLLAQPVRSLLKSWGESASAITSFSAVLALPWLFKPLFGLLSDCLPMAGTRRRSYLLVSSGATAAGLFGVFLFPASAGAPVGLLAWLLVPSAAVAFADVAADALLVERGRPLDATGRFQAAQWASMYAAGILAGVVGGEICEHRLERWSFLLCGVGASVALIVVWFGVREPASRPPASAVRERLRRLRSATSSPTFLGIGGFLFLWNFNPFSNAILHLHLTTAVGFSERFFGALLSLWALAALAASLLYGLYCRRVSMARLAHASIGLGMVSTLAYLFVDDEVAATVVTALAGFAYMTATLIQLDLAARHCPPEVAGTVFALLMAVENLAASLSVWLGGLIYDQGAALWGARGSFLILLLIAAATTACCWPLLAVLPRSLFETPHDPAP